MTDQIICHLKNSDHILITTHTNPDGDAIGSLIAMGLSLDKLNKKTTLYNESSIPAVYRFLPSVDRIVKNINPINTYDTAIILDCGDLQRIGTLSSIVQQIPVIINIDHHITNTRFGDLHLIDTSSCAATEIVYRLIKKMAIPINKAIATSIYTGILTDTGSFRFSNTNKAAFKICDEMVAIGVDPYKVAQHVYGTYSLSRIKLLNLALDSLEISYNGKLSMMTLTQKMLDETGTHPEDIDGLINYARIEDVKVAVLIQENSNGKVAPEDRKLFHVSLRSDGTVDVAAIAYFFGGGGHFSAAGFSIESTLSDLKHRIIQLSEIL
ncbi:MAG: bifunctional oligoribonuclease/PAP phosphatase NrnA [Desulfobacterales bacterium]|nr:bifunctional oligoribonuclease/PAP phosphatase NrnA [Desulfobacterales bacterium]